MAEESEVTSSEATETSSRDDVAAALDAVEARDAAPAPVIDKPAPEAAPAPAEVREDGRDALGRFAPSRTPAGPTAAPAPAGPTAAAQPAPSASAPASDTPALPPRHARAPASWSATEAAHWEKTPAEVREAVMRRETEVQRVMQEASSARSGLSALQQTIAPYIPNIQAANGGDVVGAIRTFFDYDNRMRHGSQIEKARAASALIKGYGIDIAALDNELAGAQHSPEQQQQDALKAALARELAPVRQFLAEQQQAQQHQQQAMVAEVDQGLQDFARDHTHYDAVRLEMADLLDIASQQGRRMTLNDAYERACWQNPTIRATLVAGQQSAVANTQHQAAQRARAAAVGVRNAPRAGAPANGVPPENRSRADDIAAAIAAHAGEI